jgi:glycerol-3-phosphate dehydrogenase subunit B
MKDFTARLKENIRSDTTHIGVPPVLGIANHAEIFETMSSELHPRLFEVIVPEFAIHGQRLQASLDGALRRSGVRITTVEVRDVTTNGAKIKDLRLVNMNATLTASGASYIVATGKFGSGGLVAGDYLRDPLFGLPLFVDGECVDKRPVRELVRPHVTGKQPFLSCGLHIDDSLRPLDRQGRPAFENLFAAGSVIGEYDYVAERCGLGVAILTGYLAGQQAAERSAAGG